MTIQINPDSEYTVYYAIQEETSTGEWETIATYNHAMYSVEYLKEKYLPKFLGHVRLVRITNVVEVL